MDFRLGIEIHAALFIALAENDAFSGFEIHILDVEADQLAHADSGGVKQVNHGQVAKAGAAVPELFDILVGDDLLHGFLVLILWMRRMGLFRMWSSSSSHEKKLEMFRRMLSMVALLQFRRC